MRKLRAANAHLEQTVKELEARDEQRGRDLELTRNSLRDPEPELTLPIGVEEVIGAVRRERISYLPERDLRVLARQVRATEFAARPGLIIEAGTALGGSAIAMASAKSPQRRMLVYDVFGMIPEPSERDGADVHERYAAIARGESQGLGGDTYYGYHDDLLKEVIASFERHGLEPRANNIELVQGLFEDTIEVDEPVAFLHVDGDWYDSTMTCLNRLAPLVVSGGRIVLDDYFNWSGCRRAVDDYFRERSDYRLEYRAKLHAIRR